MASSSEQEYGTTQREESDAEICQQVQRHIPETRQYGGRPERPTGTILLSRRGQNICLPSFRNDTGNPTEPSFRADEERLCSRRNRATEGHYGQRSQNSHINTTRILEECGSQDNASNEKPQCSKRDGREGNRPKRANTFRDDGISGLQMPKPAENARPTKMQVTSVALQTDLCDTLYVTKNTLVAYTIAVVQNTQMFQYKQMHVELQMAQNQASPHSKCRYEWSN